MVYKIAIIGATGVVGRTVLQIMFERNLLLNDIHIFAERREKGKKIVVEKRKFVVESLDEKTSQQKFDFALFCTREDVSKRYVKLFAQNGTQVVDFSSQYRKKFPLIVPEINPDKIRGNIICNPNCSTIAAVMALYNIHKKYGIERIVYSTYQAVSGAGKDALEDLYKKRQQNLKGLPQPIFNNLICFIGKISKDGYSKEERKMIYETRKILGDKDIKITATCVRVPIDVCHSESINFQTRKKAKIKDIENVLSKTEGVEYKSATQVVPMPKDVRGQDKVFVGRVRKDFSAKNTFNIFVVSDNLRKGAAQNGVQILQELIKRKKK